MSLEKQEYWEIKYKLPPENIVCLDENSEVRQRFRDYFLGLSDEGIDWPMEMQGGGISDYKTKEFEVYYPKGDLFISFAFTLHELGHLRQGEIDKRFSVKTLGAPKPELEDDLEFHSETEEDAWQRGLIRAKKYCPEFLDEIEIRFKKHKEQSKLKDFENFESFFNYLVRVGLKITEFSDMKECKEETRQAGRKLGQYLKSDGLTNTFFTKPKRWRVGEIIDQEKIESFIKTMAEKIAEESY
ncbi:hypothetical protein KKF32_04505 [Patescibacteria group bacterium]|nr:hypothetical protein [Patescibacteria group bacterium]